MKRNYSDFRPTLMTITLPDGTKVFGEFFDGERINPESIPQGKTLYHTRHDDDYDWATPATISPNPILVNFCGSFVADKADITTETDIIEIEYEE